MALTVRYIPPKVDPRVALHAVVPLATNAGAHVLLAKADPLVPEDTGKLRASGRVTQDGDRAVVSFSAIAPDGYDYAAIQHERMDFQHEHGQARYLDQPMHEARTEVFEAVVEVLRKAF